MSTHRPYYEYCQQPDISQGHHVTNAPSTHVRATSMVGPAPASFEWSSTNAHYTTHSINANMASLNGLPVALQQQQNFRGSRLQQPRQMPLPAQRRQGRFDHEKPPSPYFIDRGNGQYTRLIPADMLPDLVEVPKREGPDAEGTRLPGSECGNKLLTLKQSGGDAVQSRIDTLTSASKRGVKREKIYCDKWVHEGICSFAQQGCRYLHVMPEDEATQQLLGLYQGYPPWWRKKLEQDALAAGAPVNRVDGMSGPVPAQGTSGGLVSMSSVGRHDMNRGHSRAGDIANGHGWVDNLTNPQSHGEGRNSGYTWIAESAGIITPNGSQSSRDGHDGGSGFISPTRSGLMNRRSLGAYSYGPIQRPPWAEKQ